MIVQPIDLLRPFHLERSHLRGRAVRLGATIDYVLGAHVYPAAVSDLLGELLILAGALAGGLKFAGRFSLQIRGDGPVRLLVADCTNDGQMRGYAGFDAERLEAAAGLPPMALLGRGVLALTVDNREAGGETYQGIVELGGGTLAACMAGYFDRSEQVPTAIRVALGRDALTRRWQAGCIMLQAMPGSRPDDGEVAADDWQRASLLMDTASDAELIDPALPIDDLLYRLFHEDGVRVFEPQRLFPGCTCDEERVTTMLRSFPDADLEEMRRADGSIDVTCQFCGRHYAFDRAAVDALERGRRH